MKIRFAYSGIDMFRKMDGAFGRIFSVVKQWKFGRNYTTLNPGHGTLKLLRSYNSHGAPEVTRTKLPVIYPATL